MPARVGIPRSLGYFAFLPMWQTFFEELGAEVVVSPPTDKEVLDRGVEEAVSDACVPIKLYLGHVRHLAGMVDYLFIPRLVNVFKGRNRVFCPKFLGLPDMVRHSMEGLPRILDPRIDFRRGKIYFLRQCLRLARVFSNNLRQQVRAIFRALMIYRRFNAIKRRGLNFFEALRRLEVEMRERSPRFEDVRWKSRRSGRPCPDPDLRVAVIGYPYALYDEYTSVDLLDRLAELGAAVVTPDMISDRVLKRYRPWFKKELFWTFSDRAAKAGYHLIAGGLADGVVHVTAFGCGPDSMVNKLLELEAQKRRVPYLTVMIDEHTGEAGISTRIEAFVDMVRRRKELAG